MDPILDEVKAIPEAPLQAIDKTPTPQAKPPTVINIADNGWKPVAKTFEDQQRLARMYKESKVLPERFNSDAMIITALHFASEHFPGKEMTALRNIAVINGTPSLFGDLPLAMVQRSPEFAMIDERFNPEDGNIDDDKFQAVCKVTRVKPGGHELIVTRCFSVADAKRAQLWGKNVWKAYPKRMLQMRARSWALKDCFADVLMGIAIVEYDFNGDPDVKDVSPVAESVKGLIIGENNGQSVQ